MIPDLRVLRLSHLDTLRGTPRWVFLAIAGRMDHAGRCHPTVPTIAREAGVSIRGTRLALALELSAGLIGSSYVFAKLTGLGQRWFRLRRDQVISLQLFVGAVFGAAPLFDRFHIGDLNALVAPRALGLTFSTLPSRNLLRDGIQRHRYGELAARVLVEYAYPLFRGRRYVYGGDLFVNAGLFVLADNEDLRSRSGPLWCSLPMDLTFDLGLRLDTLIGVFNLSLANALGRLPF